MAIELHPLEQFEIHPLVPLHIGKLDVSFTNSALLMAITVLALSALVWAAGLYASAAAAQHAPRMTPQQPQ